MVDCIRWRESQLLDLAMNSCLVYAFVNIPIAAALDQDLRPRTIDCGGQQHPASNKGHPRTCLSLLLQMVKCGQLT